MSFEFGCVCHNPKALQIELAMSILGILVDCQNPQLDAFDPSKGDFFAKVILHSLYVCQSVHCLISLLK